MTATPAKTQRRDKITAVSMTQDMWASLEALRRREGERSVSAVVRNLIEEGFERRAAF